MPPSPQLSSSGVFDVFTAGSPVGKRLGTDVINLLTAWPGWAQGAYERPPREIMYVGGTLVVTDEAGNTVTFPATMAGFFFRDAPGTITAASTATAVHIAW